jgi:replicative DNA helicase
MLDQLQETLTLSEYLARLVAEATTVLNAPDYARTISDLALRRKLIVLGELTSFGCAG